LLVVLITVKHKFAFLNFMPKITIEQIEYLQLIVGKENVFYDEESIEKYSRDETEKLKFNADVIVKPKTTDEVASIMKFCNNNLIHVTPRGAGTGLSGGALAIYGGVLLCTDRMNSIIKIDTKNMQVITEPGVITEELMNAIKEKRFILPTRPK
jgi:glycolate oxidase